MYKIMILLNNFSSGTTWPIFTKFHVDPNVEMGLRVCSNTVYNHMTSGQRPKPEVATLSDGQSQSWHSISMCMICVYFHLYRLRHAICLLQVQWTIDEKVSLYSATT